MCELGDKKERSLYKHRVTFFGAHEKKDIASFSPCAFNVTGFLIVIFRTCHYPAEDAHFLLQLASNFILTCAAADKQTKKLRASPSLLIFSKETPSILLLLRME